MATFSGAQRDNAIAVRGDAKRICRRKGGEGHGDAQRTPMGGVAEGSTSYVLRV